MKILKNTLTNELNIRTEKDYPIEGMEFIDITPLISQKETLEEITDKFVEELKDKKIDYIIAPEARGFLYGAPVAYKLGVGLVPVRKKGKLPPTVVDYSFEYEKEYGKDNLELPKLSKGDDYAGKRVYLIDDIYATGNTMSSIKLALTEAGAIVVGEGVVMNIKELNNNEKLFSLLDVNEE